MIHKGRIFLTILIALTLAISPSVFVQADSGIIHEKSELQTITQGVTLESITRFTVDGWLSIKVLRVDLSNRYIEVDSISNPESITKLTSTRNLAASHSAVAAVNASFFNPTGDGNGYPDGPIVESGRLISAYGEYNKYGDTMASFSIDKLNNVMYNYWKTSISLIAPSGDSITVNQFNKPSRLDYNDFTIIDRKWSSASIGLTENYPDITEMVVDDGRVVEIRQGQPAVEIPVNGYVVVTRQAGGSTLAQYFKAGDRVDLDIATTPDWNNLKMSVTGASILVSEGRIPQKFSFDIPYISKKQPRTAIGSTQDGRQLILVTVDGRQNSSIGMTQSEIARYMLELGAYNALNLDGGASTTMAARKPGTYDIQIVNTPSDGMARAVSNAIGIFSIAPTSPLAGIIVDTEDANVFVNTSRAFTVRGYDRYFNPVEIKPEQVKWSVSGVKGSFKDNVFYPQSVGEGRITASVGNISGSVAISSLSSPVRLKLSEKLLKLSVNQSRSFAVTGVNKNGFAAKINPEDVNWAVKGGIGTFKGNTFTASAKGAGYIDASVGNTHAYCAVSVASDTVEVIDTFEAENGSFLSYPSTVKGRYSITSGQKHSGKSSGRLNYEFSASEETEAAYMVYPNGGIPIEGASKIGVWIYSTHTNSNWLRAEVIDKEGKKHLVGLSKIIDWTGWKYVEASLEGINPSSVTRLYIAKVHPAADSGRIYFDDLTVTRSGYPTIDMSKIPEDTVPVDEANKAVTYKPSGSSFRFAVLGQSRAPRNPLEKLLLTKLADKINKYIDAAAYVGNMAHEVSVPEKPVLSTSGGHKSFDIKNSRFIQLDMSKQGLRASSREQWHWLIQQLETAKGDNVFIFLAGSPDSFSDSLEAGLLKETLTKYRLTSRRNVWVFYKGSTNTSYMERGVRYITSTGFELEGLSPDNPDSAKYILVTIQDGAVTFEFKPII
jgi:exopolysaccharide biosynthesis protein